MPAVAPVMIAALARLDGMTGNAAATASNRMPTGTAPARELVRSRATRDESDRPDVVLG